MSIINITSTSTCTKTIFTVHEESVLSKLGNILIRV